MQVLLAVEPRQVVQYHLAKVVLVVGIEQAHVAIDEEHQVLIGQVKVVRGARVIVERNHPYHQLWIVAAEEVDCEVVLACEVDGLALDEAEVLLAEGALVPEGAHVPAQVHAHVYRVYLVEQRIVLIELALEAVLELYGAFVAERVLQLE